MAKGLKTVWHGAINVCEKPAVRSRLAVSQRYHAVITYAANVYARISEQSMIGNGKTALPSVGGETSDGRKPVYIDALHSYQVLQLSYFSMYDSDMAQGSRHT
jgi:hypothetical protein